MKTIVKFFLSLLVGIGLTILFFYLGQQGLFDSIDATFYSSRILNDTNSAIRKAQSEFAEYQSALLNEIQDLLYSPPFRQSFETSQSSSDIEIRQSELRNFRNTFPSFVRLRIIDDDLLRIHYSSNPEDIANRSSTSLQYLPYRDAEDTYEKSELKVENLNAIGDWQRIFDSELQHLLYVLPLYNSFDIFRGWGIVEFNTRTLSKQFASEQIISYGENIQLIDPDGILLGGIENSMEIISMLEAEYQTISNNSELNLSIDGLGNFKVHSLRQESATFISLIPLLELGLTEPMRIMLTALVFFTSFLLLFLLLSIRQSKESIIRERVTKFQLELLQQFQSMDSSVDIITWKQELRIRKNDIQKRILAGISESKRKKYAPLIAKGWENMLLALENSDESKNLSQFTVHTFVDYLVNIFIRSLNSFDAPRAEHVDEYNEEFDSSFAVEGDEIEELEELGDIGNEIQGLDELELVEDTSEEPIEDNSQGTLEAVGDYPPSAQETTFTLPDLDITLPPTSELPLGELELESLQTQKPQETQKAKVDLPIAYAQEGRSSNAEESREPISLPESYQQGGFSTFSFAYSFMDNSIPFSQPQTFESSEDVESVEDISDVVDLAEEINFECLRLSDIINDSDAKIIEDSNRVPQIQDSAYSQVQPKRDDELGMLVEEITSEQSIFDDGNSHAPFDEILAIPANSFSQAEDLHYYDLEELDSIPCIKNDVFDYSYYEKHPSHQSQDILRIFFRFCRRADALRGYIIKIHKDSVETILSSDNSRIETTGKGALDLKVFHTIDKQQLLQYYSRTKAQEELSFSSIMGEEITSIVLLPCRYNVQNHIMILGVSVPVSDFSNYLRNILGISNN